MRKLTSTEVIDLIHNLNSTFEYYFEEYPNIDESSIWWTYCKGKLCHVTNSLSNPGDLSVYYFTKGYCPLYSLLLKRLLPEGKILYSYNHIIFEYDDHYYDASGEFKCDNMQFFKYTEEDFNFNRFCYEGNINSRENKAVTEKMYQTGSEFISTLDSPKRKKSPESK